MSAKELAKQETQLPVEYAKTPQQIKAQVVLIQEVMVEVMKEGQHYGLIPGCGNKPSLLKAGAEKLSLTFMLRPIMDNERDIRIEELPNGHKTIHVYCHIMNQAGLELATGVGSCSTMESKFRYRGAEKISTGVAVPAKYWALKKDAKFAEMQQLLGGKGYGIMKLENGQWEICTVGQKMENPDIADTYNTVLKMAKKRAYVDGILSATAASDCFTQDIEDMNEHIVDVEPEPTKTEVKKEPVKQSPPPEAVAEAEVVKPKATPAPVATKPAEPKPEPAQATPSITKKVQGLISDKKIKPFIDPETKKAGNKYGCKIGENWYGSFNSKVFDFITEAHTNRILVNCSYCESSVTKDGKTSIYYNIVELKPVVANEQGQAEQDI